MRPFTYVRARTVPDAVHAAADPRVHAAPTSAPAQFLAGGTNIIDFMKLGSWRAEALVDVNDLQYDHGTIEASPDGLRLGAFVRMSQAADHPAINRDFPVIAQALKLAASAQIRNMASLGGNVLQRTRCAYFRNTDYGQCNKRSPGSGCAAIGGNNRTHAVLGVNDRCISNYPGDFAQALAALDARVDISGPLGPRVIRFEELHTGPERPEVETVLQPGDLITGFFVPTGPHTRRSIYVKVRDRVSYEYGLATAAVALDLGPGRMVRDARIAMAGVAYKPYRAHAAEASLRGKPLTENSAVTAGQIAMQGAITHGQNGYKPELGRRTVARALLQAAALDV